MPSWLLLPIWLHQSPTGNANQPHRWLTDLLWAQFALFLYVRIQDDLLDSQLTDFRLQFVADRFLIDSLEHFEHALPDDRTFRDLFRGSLRRTADGILAVHALERVPGRFQRTDLGLHAEVSAIFLLATAGVCRRNRRARDADWLSAFQDQLAVFGQISDDLDDLHDDLAAGRFTFVANTLIQATPSENLDRETALARASDGLVRPDRAKLVWAALDDAAAAALRLLPDSAPPQITELAVNLRARADRLQQRMHETQVRWFLEGALGVAQ